MSAPQKQTWTTAQLRADFEVLGYSMGLVVVIRRADRVTGSLQFTHSPRVYYGFRRHDA